MGHENYAQCKFRLELSTDVTADAVSCWTLAVFILTLEKSEPKIWMHIKHCLSSAKAIPIQEAQELHCVDTAASDAENLCRWCLASPVDIFLRIFIPNSLKRLCKTCTICHTRFIYSFNRRKRILYSCHRNLLQIGNVDQELSLLVNKLTILRRKIIQQSIFFESDLFSSSGFLHE